MKILDIIKKMIDFSDGNLHDINHFMKVYSFAKLIGECENLDKNTQEILEISAVIHDIACPLCRKKYGNTNGKFQEKEGALLAEKFLENTNLSNSAIERIVYIVGHHHTYTDVKGLDYQILLEADYIVNAHESSYSKENIKNTIETIFKTKTGINLAKSMYLNF